MRTMLRPWLYLGFIQVLFAVAEEEHEGEQKSAFEELIRDGLGHCLEPITDATDDSLIRAVCYSPAMHLKPGQVSSINTP